MMTAVKGPVLRTHINQSPFGPAIVPVDCGVKFGNLHFFQPDARGNGAWRGRITSNLYLWVSFDDSQPLDSGKNGSHLHNESAGGGRMSQLGSG